MTRVDTEFTLHTAVYICTWPVRVRILIKIQKRDRIIIELSSMASGPTSMGASTLSAGSA